MRSAASRYRREQSAGAKVEYVLIIGLIALAIILSAGLLGTSADLRFHEPAAALGQRHETLGD